MFIIFTSRCIPCCRSICIRKFAVFFFEQAINVFRGHNRQTKCMLRAELGKLLLLNLKKRCERNSYLAVNSSCSAVRSFPSSGSAMLVTLVNEIGNEFVFIHKWNIYCTIRILIVFANGVSLYLWDYDFSQYIFQNNYIPNYILTSSK